MKKKNNSAHIPYLGFTANYSSYLLKKNYGPNKDIQLKAHFGAPVANFQDGLRRFFAGIFWDSLAIILRTLILSVVASLAVLCSGKNLSSFLIGIIMAPIIFSLGILIGTGFAIFAPLINLVDLTLGIFNFGSEQDNKPAMSHL